MNEIECKLLISSLITDLARQILTGFIQSEIAAGRFFQSRPGLSGGIGFCAVLFSGSRSAGSGKCACNAHAI